MTYRVRIVDIDGISRTAQIDAPSWLAAERRALAWLAQHGDSVVRVDDRSLGQARYELASGAEMTITSAADAIPRARVRAVRVRSKFDSTAVRAARIVARVA